MKTKSFLDRETNKYILLQARITNILSELRELRDTEKINTLDGQQVQRKAVLEASLISLKEMGQIIRDNIQRLQQRGGFCHYE